MKKKKGAAQPRPYAQRLAQQKIDTITAHREDAAQTVAALACITLNDLDHWGKERLDRFANLLMQNVHEYYSDRERMDAWLMKRLKALGFNVAESDPLPKVLDMEWVQVKRGTPHDLP